MAIGFTKRFAMVSAFVVAGFGMAGAGQASGLGAAVSAGTPFGLYESHATGLALWIPPAAVAPVPGSSSQDSAVGRIETLGSRVVAKAGGGGRFITADDEATPEPAPAFALVLGLVPLLGLAAIARRMPAVGSARR